jgi:pimeloyl-ACP methyl ester carboxylesterase
MTETPTRAVAGSVSRDDGATIAYDAVPRADGVTGPGIVFLHGLMSDRGGDKALRVEAFCRTRGLASLRFDYFGHGESSGTFTDGTIGRWAEDAVAVIDQLTEGPQVLVGSSLGGWIMLLAARHRPDRIAALVGLASAADFTEDIMPAVFSSEQLAAMERDGRVDIPSDYGEEPYTFTQHLLDEGRDHLLLRGPIPIQAPVRLIHGMRDPDVPWETSMRIREHLESDDVEVILVKNGDHRLSEPRDLERLDRTLDALIAHIGSQP